MSAGQYETSWELEYGQRNSTLHKRKITNTPFSEKCIQTIEKRKKPT